MHFPFVYHMPCWHPLNDHFSDGAFCEAPDQDTSERIDDLEEVEIPDMDDPEITIESSPFDSSDRFNLFPLRIGSLQAASQQKDWKPGQPSNLFLPGTEIAPRPFVTIWRT